MKTGRPIGFDPDAALDTAMTLFWTKGFEATSTRDLMDAMKLSKSSLYQSFGSKRELFLTCLERYCQKSIGRQRQQLTSSAPGKQYLMTLFKGIINQGKQAGMPRGCLLVNTACEFGDIDKELSTFVESKLNMTREMFQREIENAQRNGEISVDKDAQSLAHFLLMSSIGLRTMSNFDIDQSTLESIVDQIFAHLD